VVLVTPAVPSVLPMAGLLFHVSAVSPQLVSATPLTAIENALSLVLLRRPCSRSLAWLIVPLTPERLYLA